MADPTPLQTVQEMLDYSENIAEQMLEDMDEEETTLMVRDFVAVIAQWQPNVAKYWDDPTMSAISCLATSFLFQKAFRKAYLYTDKKVDAINALKNALPELD